VLDGAVEVVVITFSALFSTPILDFELFAEDPGYFCPFFDTTYLIKFPQCLVFLSE
jgi:hypothetical protein